MKEPSITGKEIQDEVFKRLEKYNSLNFLEQFAMFMGRSQILEIGLKSILISKYRTNPDQIDKWPLGVVKEELKKQGLRSDFISLLESLVDHRNFIAHDLLASQAILHGIVNNYDGRFEVKALQKALFELEQIIFLFYWTQEHNAWD
ncbi:MAG: hypothetical protein JW861_04405 [Bacteroidales bacterium]|nr:hypothetical protein [Bacteroidales bacterium]